LYLKDVNDLTATDIKFWESVNLYTPLVYAEPPTDSPTYLKYSDFVQQDCFGSYLASRSLKAFTCK